MAPQTRRCCGLVVAMLGEALGEEIICKFAGLFETIDPFFNDKVNPSVMIEAGEIVFVDKSLRYASSFDFNEFRSVEWSPEVEVGYVKARKAGMGGGKHAVELEFDQFK